MEYGLRLAQGAMLYINVKSLNPRINGIWSATM